MSSLAQDRVSRIRRRTGASILTSGTVFLYAPFFVGIIVLIDSMINGASAEYVALQFSMFILLIPLLFILKMDDILTSSILMATFIKIFYVSQIICMFIGRAPDAGLSSPAMTLIGMNIGMLSGMAGILLARLVVSSAPTGKPLLTLNMTPERLRRLGYITAAIGIPAQIVWSVIFARQSVAEHSGVGQTASGLVVFSCLTPLTMLSLCCFAAEQLIVTNRRALLSRPFLIILGIYLAAILPLATKTEPLKPVVAIFAVAVAFRWKPQFGILAGGLAMVLFVSQFLYPVIDYSRMHTDGGNRTGVETFAEVATKSAVDPTEFSAVKAYSKDLNRGVGQLYFGDPIGFFDRFTPLLTDRLITNSAYVQPQGVAALGQAAASLIPQTFGVKRDITGAQLRVESALRRSVQSQGKVGWDNSGFIGDGFINGGLPMAALFMFIFCFVCSMGARMTFGARRLDVFWPVFLVTFMFTAADGAFVTVTPLFFWGWGILTGSIFVILKWLERRDPGISAPIGST
jgi:hypothetical protein